MKRIFTLAVLFLFTMIAFAGNVSEQQALQKAMAFLKANNRSGINVKAKTAAHKAPRKAQAAASSYYYVFNLENSQGFVIVSGDDRTEAILGYADNGTFDANNIPSNVKYLLDGYVEEMEWMEENGYSGVQGTPQYASTTVVSPLLTSQWNQGAPYYNLCPVLNGYRCVTGCVATAMAQIMYYHKWPTGTVAKINGYTCDSGAKVDTLQATTFDWSNMTDIYNSYSSSASRTAVAKLMAYCGSAVRMDYSPSGSGAVSYNVVSALKNRFGYASSVQQISRAGYSVEEWDALITNELVNNRPVYYSGSTSSNEGHAFVCDGRRADGMFHINWGWGGSMDGYYRLSLLDPSSQGIGGSSTGSKFSMRQAVIVGISKTAVSVPTQNATVGVGRQSIKNSREYTRTSTTKDFSNITIAVPFSLLSGTYNVQSVGLALYQNGTYSSLLTSKNIYVYNTSMYAAGPSEFTIEFGSGLSNGTYQIVPVVYRSSSSQWVKVAQADKNYIEAVINGTKLSLKIYPQGDFQVTNTSFTDKNLIVNFVNNTEEYNGYIYMFKEGGSDWGEEVVAVPAESSDKVNIYVDDETFTENEVFFLSTDYYKREYFYTNLSAENTNVTKTIDLLNANEEKTAVYGKAIRFRVALTNTGTGDYHHRLITELYDATNTATVIATNKQVVDVPAGETVTVEQEFALTDAQMGKTYLIKAAHVNGSSNVYLSTKQFDVEYGATAWDAEGNVMSIPASDGAFTVPETVVAIDLRVVGTTNITPNSNPNTIYLLESVPTSLKGKNVMNSLGRTGTLTLHDGYPYYIPQQLQAKKVYYKRTFTADEAGSWTTIALPFAPNAVRDDTGNKALTWHTSEADTGKDFWIQELRSVSGNNLTFANISTFTANRPYIISVPETLAGKTISFQKVSTVFFDVVPAAITHTVGQVTLHGVCGDTDVSGKYVLRNDKFMKAGSSAGAKGALKAGANTTAAPFRVYATMEGGSYDQLLINSSHTTAIRTINTDEMHADGNETWYTINGVRLNSRPTTKGVYIVNGKKVVVK